MAETIRKAKKCVTSAQRLKAFAKTINDGVSPDYLKHIKQEARENRIIEKYL